ncbi:hypothetical protein SAMN05421809_3605 [Natronorubrum daqingense]|uniref:Uncharacterized protein n=1 Tax=Natronorubrum daqingense TaxID=588898 RepID=A0A1N7FZE5_9EURY|nr:hypothetical protein SAMN05421809_3605 [Natronorubrum daqingense]
MTHGTESLESLLGQQARDALLTVTVRAVAVWPVSACMIPWDGDAQSVTR